MVMTKKDMLAFSAIIKKEHNRLKAVFVGNAEDTLQNVKLGLVDLLEKELPNFSKEDFLNACS